MTTKLEECAEEMEPWDRVVYTTAGPAICHLGARNWSAIRSRLASEVRRARPRSFMGDHNGMFSVALSNPDGDFDSVTVAWQVAYA